MSNLSTKVLMVTWTRTESRLFVFEKNVGIQMTGVCSRDNEDSLRCLLGQMHKYYKTQSCYLIQ